MTPSISVVIAAHNAERFLWETLASLQRQRFTDFETIVVDDGSTDRTRLIANRPHCRVVSITRSGVSTARNTGLALAKAPTILFLDSDDVLEADALSSLWQGLITQPHAIAVIGQHLKFWNNEIEDPKMAILRGRMMPENDSLKFLLRRNFIVNGGTILIRTDAARNSGGFDPRLRLGEDWDFWCRLALKGSFCILRDKVVLHYRQRSDGAQSGLRGNPLKLNDEAILSIFSHPEIRSRFSWTELWLSRRFARQDIFWSEARVHMLRKNWGLLFAYVSIGLVQWPETFFLFQHLTRYYHGTKNALKALRLENK